MAHHHKSNQRVEGNPDTGHGRGLQKRPDEKELDQLTEEERRRAGLPPGPDARVTSDELYEAEVAEVDRETGSGELREGADIPRSERDPFPPSHYDG